MWWNKSTAIGTAFPGLCCGGNGGCCEWLLVRESVVSGCLFGSNSDVCVFMCSSACRSLVTHCSTLDWMQFAVLTTTLTQLCQSHVVQKMVLTFLTKELLKNRNSFDDMSSKILPLVTFSNYVPLHYL